MQKITSGTAQTRAQDANGYVVRAHQISKSFGDVRAVSGLSLSILPGQVYALLGPNGAGKTTTLRILLDLVRPDDGRVELFGRSLLKSRMGLAKVGALIEAPSAYAHLTGHENLEVTRRMLGVPRASIDRVLKLVELEDAKHRKAKGYSFGMRGRLSIAMALLGSPSLLILDEPLNGLDPRGIRDMRGLIRNLPNQGVTVLLSSHQLSEVEQVATHVGVVHDGVMRFEGCLDELRGLARPSLRIQAEPGDRALEILARHCERCVVQDDEIVLMAPTAPPAELVRRLVEGGIGVSSVRTGGATLEDVFLELTERDTERESA